MSEEKSFWEKMMSSTLDAEKAKEERANQKLADESDYMRDLRKKGDYHLDKIKTGGK